MKTAKEQKAAKVAAKQAKVAAQSITKALSTARRNNCEAMILNLIADAEIAAWEAFRIADIEASMS